MAIVYTQVPSTLNNHNFKAWTVACLAADTGPTNQAHGFGVAPFVWFVKHVSAAAPPEVAVSAGVTNITITKLAAAGSVGAPYMTVFCIRPHSLNK